MNLILVYLIYERRNEDLLWHGLTFLLSIVVYDQPGSFTIPNVADGMQSAKSVHSLFSC